MHACCVVLCHLCACAHALVYGAHVGAAPATARDADQAFAVDINVRTTTRLHLRIVVFALGDAYVGTRTGMCMCFVSR